MEETERRPSGFDGRRASRMNSLMRDKRASIRIADIKRMSRRFSTKMNIGLMRRNTVQIEQIIMGNPLDNLEVLLEQPNAGSSHGIRRTMYKALSAVINMERQEDEEFERELTEQYEDADLDYKLNSLEYENGSKSIEDQQKKEGIFFVVEMNFLKRSQIYKDKFPLLEFRKKILSYMKRVSFLCFKIIKHPIFEYASLLVIIMNSFTLALQDPTQEDDVTLSKFEFSFLILYTIEMVLKILGYGFVFNKGAYLRDGWNILDFVIVTTAYIPYVVGADSGVNLSGLRSLRVLRPLRTISTIKALKTLIQALFSALPLLLDTLFILLFFFLIFAIAGLQLYSGLLKKRCIEESSGKAHADNLMCGNYDCPPGYMCSKLFDNPNWGGTNFDNIFSSFLMVFVCVTLEGWTEIMNDYRTSFSDFVVPYFFVLVFVGAFFLLNITLAVIKSAFSDSQNRKFEIDDRRKKKYGEWIELIQYKEYLRDWDEMLRKMKEINYKSPPTKFQRFLKKLAKFCPKSKETKALENLRKMKSLRDNTIRAASFAENAENPKAANPKLAEDNRNQAIIEEESAKAQQPAERELLTEDSSRNLEQPRRLTPRKIDMILSKSVNLKAGSKKIVPYMAIANITNSLHSTINNFIINPPENFLDDEVLNEVKIPGENRSQEDFIGSVNGGNLAENLEDEEELNAQKRMAKSINILTPSFHSYKHSSTESYKKLKLKKGDSRIMRFDKIHQSPLEGYSSKTVSTEQGNENSSTNILIDRMKTLKQKVKIIPLPMEESQVKREDEAKYEDGKREEEEEDAKIQQKFLRKLTNFSLEGSSKSSGESEESENRSENSLDDTIEGDSDFSPGYFKMDEEHLKRLEKKKRKKFMSKKVRPINPEIIFDIKEDRAKNNNEWERDTLNSIWDKKTTSQTPYIFGEDDRGLRRKSTRQNSQFRKNIQRRRSAFLNFDDEMEKEKQKLEIANQEKFLKSVFQRINPKFKETVVDHDMIVKSTSEVEVLEEKIRKQELERQEMLRKKFMESSLKVVYKPSIFKTKDTKGQKKGAKSKKNSSASRNNSWRHKKSSKEHSFKLPGSRSRRLLFEKSDIFENGSLKLDKANNLSNVNLNEVSSFMNIKSHNDHNSPRSAANLPSPTRSPLKKRKKIPLEFDPKNTTLEKAKEKCFVMDLDPDLVKRANEMELESFKFDELYINIRDEDLKLGRISKYNWSAEDVLQSRKNQISYLNSIKYSLMKQNKVIWIPGKIGLWIAFLSKAKALTETALFEQIIILSVIINTFILAMDGLFTDDNTLEIFKTFNLTFTIIFAMEMGVKLIAMGPKNYIRDTMNIFDGAIVILSIVEILFLSGSSKAVSAFRTVRIFRTFRVLRVTKLLRSLSFMKIIIAVVSHSLQSFIYIALLLLLFIFIYTLLGMQVYGGSLNLEDVDLNVTFNNFNGSFLAVFQIMTLENWQTLLYLCLRSSVSPIVTTIYMISWIFIGNYVLLNLFLAILLDGFTAESEQVEPDDEESSDEADKQRQFEMMMERRIQEDRQLDMQVKEMVDDDLDENVESDLHLKRKNNHSSAPLFTDIKCEKSLFIFSKKNPIRIIFYRLVHHNSFESVILFMIIVSSIKLAFDTYLPEETSMDDYDIKLLAGSQSIDYFFNIFFTIESLLKIISFGFFIEHGSYLREPWNVMDFFIVCSAMLDMSLESINLPIIKIFRLLRTLRPLRFITHNVNLKIVVLCLINSVGAIVNVLIVVLLIWLMFAILGISLLQGKMGYCDFPKVSSRYGVNKEQCLSAGQVWKIHDVNFDNIFSSMITLFIVSSLEGWPDIMNKCMDADDEEFGPSKNASGFVSYYFIFFILVGSFFFLNLFTGAIFFHFNQAHKNEKNKTSKLAGLMTEEQLRWIEMQKKIIRAKPEYDKMKKPEGKYRLFVYRVVNAGFFEVTIMTCIILNIITMAMVFDDSSEEYNAILENVNTVFTAAFIMEMVLKIFSFGFRAYWFDAWNRFDFFVVMASIVDILMSVMGQDFISFLRVGPQLARVFRILRVSRLFKLVKSFEGLQKLIQTMILTLPSLINVGALSFLVLFIYSILGCFLFKNAVDGVVIDRYTNFQNFHNAIILLFRCCTGEDWYRIMFELRAENNFSPIFFITFLLISTFIMLNLFILIILEQFEEFQRGQDPFDSYQENLENFRKTWSVYSMRYYGVKVSEKCLFDFLRTLPPPLGYGQKETKQNIAKGLLQMNLEADGEGCVYFNDLLFATMKRAFGETAIKDNADLIKQDIQEEKKEIVKFMRELEVKTRHKLETVKRLNLRREARLRKKVQASLGKNTKVNPFFFILYVKMAFQSMRRYTEEAYRLNKIDQLTYKDRKELLEYSREELYESESPDLLQIREEEGSNEESNTESEVNRSKEPSPKNKTGYQIRTKNSNEENDADAEEQTPGATKTENRRTSGFRKRSDLFVTTKASFDEDLNHERRASNRLSQDHINFRQPSKDDVFGNEAAENRKLADSLISEKSDEEDEAESETKFKPFVKRNINIITPKVEGKGLLQAVQYFDLDKEDKSLGHPTSQDRLTTDKDQKPSLSNIKRFDEEDFYVAEFS